MLPCQADHHTCIFRQDVMLEACMKYKEAVEVDNTYLHTAPDYITFQIVRIPCHQFFKEPLSPAV